MTKGSPNTAISRKKSPASPSTGHREFLVDTVLQVICLVLQFLLAAQPLFKGAVAFLGQRDRVTGSRNQHVDYCTVGKMVVLLVLLPGWPGAQVPGQLPSRLPGFPVVARSP